MATGDEPAGNKSAILQCIDENLAQNDKAMKRIRMSHAKILYKHHIDMKKLKEMVEKNVQKLNKILENAETEYADALKRRQAVFELEEKTCLNRAGDLREIRGHVENISHSSMLPESQLMPVLKDIETDIKSTNDRINTLANIGLDISSELKNTCHTLMELEKPFNMRVDDDPPIVKPVLQNKALISPVAEPVKNDSHGSYSNSSSINGQSLPDEMEIKPQPRRSYIAAATTPFSILANRARRYSVAEQQNIRGRTRHHSGPALMAAVAPKSRVDFERK